MVGRRNRRQGQVPERMSVRTMRKLAKEVVATGLVKWGEKTCAVHSVRNNGKVTIRTMHGNVSVDPRQLRQKVGRKK